MSGFATIPGGGPAAQKRSEARVSTPPALPGHAPSSLVWAWHEFKDLSPRLLYGILRLRQDIFIVEQGVPYADLDGKDLHCHHLVCSLAGDVVAYLRIVPPGLFKPGSFSFGRVTVRRDLRGVGLGRVLVARGLAQLDSVRGVTPVEISSQYYLMHFYRSFGFAEYGDKYIEDHIPHIAMRKS